jgi:putative DNA primase/helicase
VSTVPLPLPNELFNVARIPATLRAERRWSCWRPIFREEKWTKVPVNPHTLTFGSSTDPAKWATFEEAILAVDKAQRVGQRIGIGFVLGDNFAGVDIDNCVDPDGRIHPQAGAILEDLDTYSELSVSGTGVHAIFRGVLPAGRRRGLYDGLAIEMYDTGRFFAVTGNALNEKDVVERTTEAAALHARYFGDSKHQCVTLIPNVRPSVPSPSSDTELLERIRNSRQGPKFNQLWVGDTSDYDKDDSRADQALCNILAFWTDGDADSIDRLFRQSALMRDKWDRADYRDRTIQGAIARSPKRWSGRISGILQIDQPPSVPSSSPDTPPFTDLGNAERLRNRHGRDLRYCLRRWLIWDGKSWREDVTEEVVRLAMETVRSIYGESADITSLVSELRTRMVGASKDEQKDLSERIKRATEEAEAAQSWARKSEKASSIKAIPELAKALSDIAISPEILNRDLWLFNCPNGTIELRTGELRTHRREDYISQVCHVEYDAAAKCPRWEQFLSEVFNGNPDLTEFIQRAVGYSLTGDVREECLFLLHGLGRNGKGVFLNTLASVFGDYGTTTDFSTFVDTHNKNGPRDDVAHMRGRRFVQSQEAREGCRLDESLVKWLTGGDLLRARLLYENSYEFRPTHKLWLAANHKPIVRGTDPAIWSRIKLVPFEVSFAGREDRTLKQRLLGELPGILAWAVEGCIRWQEDGLSAPLAVEEATEEYRTESDDLGRFLVERCVSEVGSTVRARPLYVAYCGWCEATGERQVSEKRFSHRMVEKGYGKKEDKHGILYAGLRFIRPEVEGGGG